jgi:hypothetical protein
LIKVPAADAVISLPQLRIRVGFDSEGAASVISLVKRLFARLKAARDSAALMVEEVQEGRSDSVDFKGWA